MSTNDEHEFDDDTDELPETLPAPPGDAPPTGGVDMDAFAQQVSRSLAEEDPDELEALNYELDGDKHLGDGTDDAEDDLSAGDEGDDPGAPQDAQGAPQGAPKGGLSKFARS